MKVPLDVVDEAIIRVMGEDPPRPEGWLVHELAPLVEALGHRRSHDTLRIRLRRLQLPGNLVTPQRVQGISGAPNAYSLTMQGWKQAAEVAPAPKEPSS